LAWKIYKHGTGFGKSEKKQKKQTKLYKIPDFVVDIKRRRLEWLGDVNKMEETGLAKEYFQVKQKIKENLEYPY
jgi:hypothetical protein